MNELIVSALVGILSTTVTYYTTRKRYKEEKESAQLNNLQTEISTYRMIIEDLREHIQAQDKEIAHLKDLIDELRK